MNLNQKKNKRGQLSARNLVKSYSQHVVVDHVSIELKQGEIVGLLGPNGAGKTQTFYMLVGMIRADEGQIFLNDEDISDLPMYKRARRGIGYLAQEPSIFRKLTVRDNIFAVLEVLPMSDEEQHEHYEELMRELGIIHLADQKAYTLSGGEQRRVEVARSLATSPSFMLLDEPFVGIDPITVDDIQETITQLRDLGLGVLITDHNAADILAVVDRAYLIDDGEITISGTPEELIENEIARKTYFGERFKL